MRGFDAGKKIKGRKRHIAVVTMGNLLAVCSFSGYTRSARRSAAHDPAVRDVCCLEYNLGRMAVTAAF